MSQLKLYDILFGEWHEIKNNSFSEIHYGRRAVYYMSVILYIVYSKQYKCWKFDTSLGSVDIININNSSINDLLVTYISLEDIEEVQKITDDHLLRLDKLSLFL